MVSKTQPVTPVDYDYVRVLAHTRAMVEDYLHAAEAAEEEGQRRYLQGMARGLKLAEESYLICLEAETAVSTPEPGPFQYELKPTGSQS